MGNSLAHAVLRLQHVTIRVPSRVGGSGGGSSEGGEVPILLQAGEAKPDGRPVATTQLSPVLSSLRLHKLPRMQHLSLPSPSLRNSTVSAIALPLTLFSIISLPRLPPQPLPFPHALHSRFTLRLSSLPSPPSLHALLGGYSAGGLAVVSALENLGPHQRTLGHDPLNTDQ